MSDLRLVVFDMDGTLIDSQNLIVAAMNKVVEQFGQTPQSRSDVLSIVGLSLGEAVAQLFPHLSSQDIGLMAEGYKQNFIDLREEMGSEHAAPLYQGARELLDSLHGQENAVLGVATGKARRGLDHSYEVHGIGHYFVTHQTADDHPSKPHPSMLLRAMYETGIDASNAVMIGDTVFDIRMGQAAGMRTIAVNWGYHPVERLRSSGPDFLVEDFTELAAVLKELEG